MNYTLISFYSEPEKNGTYYTECAENLKKQCEELRIPYHIEHIEGRGNYFSNTFLKPEFILSCLNKISTPILWVDADSKLLENPILDSFNDVDIAAFRKTESNLPIFSHALFFNQTETAKRIIAEWVGLSSKYSEQWKGIHKTDHDSLVLTLNNNAKQFKFRYLTQRFIQLGLAPKSIIKSKCL